MRSLGPYRSQIRLAGSQFCIVRVDRLDSCRLLLPKFGRPLVYL